MGASNYPSTPASDAALPIPITALPAEHAHPTQHAPTHFVWHAKAWHVC